MSNEHENQKILKTNGHTFVAIPNRKKVHVIVLIVKEQQADPRVKRVYGYDEQYSNDPSLFGWIRVPSKVVVYLKMK